MQVDINTDASVVFTNKLEKLHRSALPNAIRSTLNSAAFDVKKVTMPKSADDAFTKRVPNFFKANSRVEMAQGWSVKSMKATVGFTEGGLKGGRNFAVKDLEQQERGGTIKARSFVPSDQARGGSKTKPVRPGNRLSRIKKVVNSTQVAGENRQEKFIKSAVYAGKGGHVIGNFQKAMLWKITSIRRVGRMTRIKKKALYSFERGRDVRVKGTGFMEKASMESAEKMEKWYIEAAKKQIQRLTK